MDNKKKVYAVIANNHPHVVYGDPEVGFDYSSNVLCCLCSSEKKAESEIRKRIRNDKSHGFISYFNKDWNSYCDIEKKIYAEEHIDTVFEIEERELL